MDLKIFFEPVKPELYQSIIDFDLMFHNIRGHNDHFPSLEGVQLALIGLTEYRGVDIPSRQGQFESFSNAADLIRSKFYRLHKGDANLHIADFGNLRNGNTYEDTIERIKEVGQLLINQNIVPVFIGGTHDLDLGQFKAYEGLDKLVSVLGVDARIDLMDAIEGHYDKRHLYDILKFEPNYLFQYIHLGYQSYLVNQNHLDLMESMSFEHMRLGKIQEHIDLTEPIIRDADMMSFDVGVIKGSDFQAQPFAEPFGITAQESCQMMWYAGLNEKLSSVGIYNYLPSKDQQDYPSAQIVAIMIWYFIKGFYHRRDDLSFKTNDYIQYTCDVGADPEHITFFKSKLSGKWWMQVPIEHHNRKAIIPCSYQEYKIASKGDVPDKYIQAAMRHS